MKLFLFGGAESGQERLELKMIEKVINDSNKKQLLHIPFARIKTNEEGWMPGWFQRNIKLNKDIEYLDANKPDDINKANDPLIFMSGGSQNINLMNKINNSLELRKLILEASIIIGESAGAKVLAEYFRTKGNDNNSKMNRGLGIIKNTVIEPHYIQRNRQELLLKDMEITKVKYGLGIDSLTAAEFESREFPENVKKIGNGIMEIKEI